jgi:septum formation protein
MLQNLGINFEVMVPEIDEVQHEKESPEDFVLRLSKQKAAYVCNKINEKAFILAADTVVILGQTILGKPGSENEAKQMLEMLSGNTHKVATGYSLLNETGAVLHQEVVFTDVKFKSLAPHEIEGYIKTGEPMDKAGAYGIQGTGSFMVEEIRGSFTNVVGLPLSAIVDTLSELNLLDLFGEHGN